jgi:hypothetical protein
MENLITRNKIKEKTGLSMHQFNFVLFKHRLKPKHTDNHLQYFDETILQKIIKFKQDYVKLDLSNLSEQDFPTVKIKEELIFESKMN